MARKRRRIRRYSGFIIVRTSNDDVRERDEIPSLRAYAEKRDLGKLSSVLIDDDLEGERLVRPEQAKRTRGREERRVRRDGTNFNSLTSYWRIDVRDRSREARSLTNRLRETPDVEHAYQEYSVSLGSSTPSGTVGSGGSGGGPGTASAAHDYCAKQLYLSEHGVNSDGACSKISTRGDGVGFADVELGWIFNPEQGILHKEYANSDVKLVWGENRKVSRHHGAAVLGIVLGKHDGYGINGIAPNVSPVILSSAWQNQTSAYVTTAINEAVDYLKEGDVLLIELQRDFLPVEVDFADYDAIATATANGIIVVEIAGNGAADLDSTEDYFGNRVLKTGEVGEYRESEAIIVGACVKEEDYERHGVSNYGSRVNCFALGNNLVSSGWGDLDHGGGYTTLSYTQAFGRTSGAGAIIAGAAALVQGAYKEMGGDHLCPAEMRKLLSDYNNGRTQGGDPTKNIGVMPDLGVILDNLSVNGSGGGQTPPEEPAERQQEYAK